MRPQDFLKQVWTITRHSIVQAVRMKVVLVLMIFAIVIIPSLPFLLKSDQTQAGQLRMILTYCIYFGSFLLSLLTLFLSVATLNSEIKGRQIFMLDPKPVPRIAVLIGKWLGVMVINVVLLTVIMGVTYGLVRYFGRPRPVPKVVAMRERLVQEGVKPETVDRFQRLQGEVFEKKADSETFGAFFETRDDVLQQLVQLGQAVEPQKRKLYEAMYRRFADFADDVRRRATAYQDMKAKLLRAHRVLQPPYEEDLEARVAEHMRLLEERKAMPPDKSSAYVRQEIREYFSQSAWVVFPHDEKRWVIPNVPERSGWLVVNFRFYLDRGAHDYELPAEIVINETRPDPDEKLTERSRATLSYFPGPFRPRKPYGFEVPATVRRPDGSVEIVFRNLDFAEGGANASAQFPYMGGIQVLYPAATLAENFARAGAIILIRLALIATVGIFASTFLSFPVAILLVLVIFVVGHARDYVILDILSDVYIFGSSMVPPWERLHAGDLFVRNIFRYFFTIFPNFGAYNVVPLLEEGRLITLPMILHAFFWMVLVRGGAMAVAGWYFFRRRELAAVTANT